jgi:hypothetical protein
LLAATQSEAVVHDLAATSATIRSWLSKIPGLSAGQLEEEHHHPTLISGDSPLDLSSATGEGNALMPAGAEFASTEAWLVGTTAKLTTVEYGQAEP